MATSSTFDHLGIQSTIIVGLKAVFTPGFYVAAKGLINGLWQKITHTHNNRVSLAGMTLRNMENNEKKA